MYGFINVWKTFTLWIFTSNIQIIKTDGMAETWFNFVGFGMV